MTEKYVVAIWKDKYLKDFFEMSLFKVSDDRQSMLLVEKLHEGFDFYGMPHSGCAFIRGFKKHLELSNEAFTFDFNPMDETTSSDIENIIKRCNNY